MRQPCRAETPRSFASGWHCNSTETSSYLLTMMSLISLTTLLLYLLVCAVISHALLTWWFLTDLPKHLTSLLMRVRLIPNDENWRPSGSTFHTRWLRRDWEFWVASVLMRKSWIFGKLGQVITCPGCASLHAGYSAGAAVWLAFRDMPPWFWLFSPVAGALGYRMMAAKPAAAPAKPASRPMPRPPVATDGSLTPEAWARLGVSVRTGPDGKQQLESVDPVLAAVSKFFDDAVPCFFAGCQALRDEYALRRADLGDDCPECQLNSLKQEFVGRVEQSIGLSRANSPAQVSLPAGPLERAEKAFQLLSPDPKVELPCPSQKCLDVRLDFLAALAQSSDTPQAIAEVKSKFMQRAIEAISEHE